MHAFRRSIIRRLGAPATSVSSGALFGRSRGLATRAAAPRSRVQACRPAIGVFAQTPQSCAVLRRFASTEAGAEKTSDESSSSDHHEDAVDKVESADGQEAGTVQSALNAVSSTVSHAAESVSEALGVGSKGADGGAVPGEPLTPPRTPSSSSSQEGGSGRMPPFGMERAFKPNPTIYIGNLLFDITAEDLRREFEQFGSITSTQIAADARGLSKGFGYVTFDSVEAAQAAITAKNQSTYEGRRILVNFQLIKSRQMMESSNPPSRTIFIGNLPFELSDADLNKLFQEVRNCTDVRVAVDRRTGQPRGFAHADFTDIASATKAVEALQGRVIYGRSLRIDYSAGATRQGRPQSSYDSSSSDGQANAGF